MRILLATGIYPPAIGGPATYSRALAEELSAMGHEVTVVTYAKENDQGPIPKDAWHVERVPTTGGPFKRWRRYAAALKEHGPHADIVYCFSSVSAGVPLLMAKLHQPKKVLRLGGDFLWERYTDRGETKSLREFYGARSSPLVTQCMGWLLGTFHYIVFSTHFQEEIYEERYLRMPPHSVIENALTFSMHSLARAGGAPPVSLPPSPFRLLFMGRFVGFKNLPSLVQAMTELPDCTLSIVGQGPWGGKMEKLVAKLGLRERVTLHKPVHGKKKQETFDGHHLLVLPSITEISPNVALEARSHGLPVLLTRETGLSAKLRAGMVIADLSTSERIARAVSVVRDSYAECAREACAPMEARPWRKVAEEHVVLFARLHSAP